MRVVGITVEMPNSRKNTEIPNLKQKTKSNGGLMISINKSSRLEYYWLSSAFCFLVSTAYGIFVREIYLRAVLHTSLKNLKNLKKPKELKEPFTYVSNKCVVFIHLQWIDNVSSRFKKQMKHSMQCCYATVKPGVVFTTKPMLPLFRRMHFFLILKARQLINLNATVRFGMGVIRLVHTDYDQTVFSPVRTWLSWSSIRSFGKT